MKHAGKGDNTTEIEKRHVEKPMDWRILKIIEIISEDEHILKWTYDFVMGFAH